MRDLPISFLVEVWLLFVEVVCFVDVSLIIVCVVSLVVLGGDAVNNPEQRWNELRVPGCSRLPHFCFCFFPGMQRAEQVNRNKGAGAFHSAGQSKEG